MFKSRKKALVAAVALGVGLLIFGISIFFFLFKHSAIPHHGMKVSCIVTRTEKFFDNETVYGRYQDDSGEYIDVEILNFPDPYDGQEVEGYVLPDDPYTVHVPAALWMKIVTVLLASFGTLSGIILILGAILQKRDFDFLSREGNFVTGEVYSVQKETVDKDVWYIFSIVYTDSEGGEHSFDIRYDNKKMMTGDRCTVVYAKRKNGKYANEIVDM